MLRSPAFLFCLGATKAGTSWLYRHLLTHPECRFRSIKELHYFNMSRPGQFDKALRDGDAKIARLAERLGSAAAAEQRADLARQIEDLADWRDVLARKTIDVAAYRQFLLKGADDARLVGDVTPAYGLLSVERMQGLAAVAPDTRFVYLIRDPVERLWSHVRMIAARTVGPADFAREAEALLRRMLAGDMSGEGQGIADRGDYATVITKIKQALPPEKVAIEFLEQLLTRPGIARLWGFLGLSPAAAKFDQPANAGRTLAIPENLRVQALAWLRPQYEYVASLFPVLPDNWRRNMEEGFA